MKAAAPFTRLDPDQAGGAFTGPGAAARPALPWERRAVAGKPELGHALATGANSTGRI
jgi:hypothetical protein